MTTARVSSTYVKSQIKRKISYTLNGLDTLGLKYLWSRGKAGTPEESDRLLREIDAAVERALEDFE